jgi:hypothetical protein
VWLRLWTLRESGRRSGGLLRRLYFAAVVLAHQYEVCQQTSKRDDLEYQIARIDEELVDLRKVTYAYSLPPLPPPAK